MADLSGLPPPRMRLLALLVILGVMHVTVSFHCPKVMNQALIADPKDCRKYYHCLTDGRFFVKSCPNGLVFEPKAKVCVWDSSRSCIPQIFDAEEDNVVAPMAKQDTPSTSRAAASNSQKSTTTDSQKTSKKTVQTSKATETSTAKVEQTTSGSKQTTTETETTPETKTPKKVETVKEETNVETSSAATTTVDFSTEKSNENTTETTNTTDMRASENPTDGNSTESGETERDETSTPLVVKETTESFKTVQKKEVEARSQTQAPKHNVLKRSPFEDNRIDSDSGKVRCTSAFAYVTDPENCHTFYHCNNWRPFQKRCPPGLFFDSQNLVCNWPHNVNCIQGYRAKTYFAFNNMRRRMHPQTLNSINKVNKVDEDSRDSKFNKVNKVKTTESTTEKIPFLETIENDVRKVKYDEDVDSTTAHATEKIAVTVRSYDRYGHRFASSSAPETSSVADTTTSEQTTTTESTTTESTTPSTPPTSTDSWVYETRASETRSTWKDWNFDLFYTSSDRQGSELDRLELFSNGKKAQIEKKVDEVDATDAPSTSSSSSSPSSDSSSTSGSPTASARSIWDNMSEDSDDTTVKTDSSAESDATTTSQAPSSEPETSSILLDTNATITTTNLTSSSNDSVTLDDIEKTNSTSNDTNTTEKDVNSTTTVPEDTSRASSFDFGSDAERERSHPRKIQQDAPPASNPFLASDRFAANQQSMYARDYHNTDNVEDVEIEKFMMKMLNDAMQSKHLVARQASEEYPDNLVDASYDKGKMTKDTEMGGSDVFDKWAIADKEGKKSKGTLIEEIESETEEIESSGEVEVSAHDTENTITNLIMKDEAKPAEPETKTTPKPENITEVTDVSKNDTEAEIVTETVDSNTTDTKDINATITDAAPSTTTTASTTTTTTTQATVNETTTVTESEAATTSESAEVVTKEETATVKAVPLLKDVSDLCTEKNNCSATAENKTEETTTTTESITTEKIEATKTEINNTENEAITSQAPNVTESVNVTEKAETETTTTTTTTTTPALNVTEAVTTTATAEPIAKDAAGNSAKDALVPSDNAIFKDDKAVEVDEKHLPLSENATKPEAVTVTTTVNVTQAETENATEIEIATNTTESEIQVDASNTTTVTEIVKTTSNDTEVEQTTSADDTSDDVTESTSSTSTTSSTSSQSSKMTSTLTAVVDTSSTDGRLAIGGSKGTTKKSFISLSDLIKWYLRHWRHYSRWRDGKEVRPAAQ